MSMSGYVLNEGFLNGKQENEEVCSSSGVFECKQKKRRGGMSTWEGRWSIYEMGEDQVEMDVYAGGWGFHAIVGRYASGHYLCIPDWKVGCALSGNLCDTPWNYDSISNCLKPFEAISMTTALADFSRKTGWGNRWD